MRIEGLIECTLGRVLPDEKIVAQVRAGAAALFEIIMRCYNGRLYQVARAIIGHNAAEDVVQDAHVRAY
jgi:RNA polymerase sigma-70 factor (ECF subfamily)